MELFFCMNDFNFSFISVLTEIKEMHILTS